MPAISTPCNNVCVVEPATQMCVGCGRTLTEIAEWSRLDEARRVAIMALLPTRLAGPAPGRGALEQAAPPPRHD